MLDDIEQVSCAHLDLARLRGGRPYKHREGGHRHGTPQ